MNRKLKILVAEDDDKIREGLLDAMEYEGYDAKGAANGSEALKAYCDWNPDLIILDIMMPKKSGYDVCREIRRGNSRIPIIMLTAKGEEVDKVLGLELGADDYVSKPFGLKELSARIHAVLRRSNEEDNSNEANFAPDNLEFGKVKICFKKMQGDKEGKIFPLTKIELEILRCLNEHPGEVVDRRTLTVHVWGPGFHGCSRKLDQHISQLRKKLEKDPADPKHILSIYGTGYRLDK